MPHLIKTIYTFIVGILQVKRIDFLTDFSQVQKQ